MIGPFFLSRRNYGKGRYGKKIWSSLDRTYKEHLARRTSNDTSSPASLSYVCRPDEAYGSVRNLGKPRTSPDAQSYEWSILSIFGF
jgi:hypothetical protein